MAKHPAFEGDIVTDQEWDTAVAAMQSAGRTAGTNAGGWVADGNTPTKALYRALQRIEDGDDFAGPPAPFSGEWADSPTVEEVIDRETELDPESLEPEERDELAQAFEDHYFEAWYEEAERTIRNLIGE